MPVESTLYLLNRSVSTAPHSYLGACTVVCVQLANCNHPFGGGLWSKIFVGWQHIPSSRMHVQRFVACLSTVVNGSCYTVVDADLHNASNIKRGSREIMLCLSMRMGGWPGLPGIRNITKAAVSSRDILLQLAQT